MVRIRLSRIGRKNLPSYKIVVLPQRSKRDTKFIEELGFHQPLEKKSEINKERAEYWLSVGAQPSKVVETILIRKGIIAAPAKARKFADKIGKKKQERMVETA